LYISGIYNNGGDTKPNNSGENVEYFYKRCCFILNHFENYATLLNCNYEKDVGGYGE
jgi:hypothetical protein